MKKTDVSEMSVIIKVKYVWDYVFILQNHIYCLRYEDVELTLYSIDLSWYVSRIFLIFFIGPIIALPVKLIALKLWIVL